MYLFSIGGYYGLKINVFISMDPVFIPNSYILYKVSF